MSANHQRPGAWPFLAIGLAVLIFANAFPAVKVCIAALQTAEIAQPALAFVPLRFGPAALIYLILGATVLRREAAALLREHPWRITLGGLCVVGGYNIFFNLGLEEINPGVSSLIIATAPLQTLLLSIPLLGESVRLRQLLGIAVGFAGIFIIVRWGQGHAVTPAMFRGAILTLFAPTMWALYTVLLKPVMARHRPIVVTAVAVVIGTLPVLPLFRLEAATALLGAPILWGSWMFMSLGATVLAFYLWNVPLRVISPSALAIFVYFIPLVAVASSILLWRTEHFSEWLAVGGGVVIAGVALANEALWRRQRPGTG
jgi:drug/metabolite transporter (DMT)-like permease